MRRFKKIKSMPDSVPPPSPDEVLSFYETLPTVYAPEDRWLSVTHRWITDFIQTDAVSGSDANGSRCLNLGSAGLSYGIDEKRVVHVDIHAGRFVPGQTAVIADIQCLPHLDGRFSHCICVGSVINHCDAAAVIAGVSEALEVGGTFILEFETSRSLELLFSHHFNRAATVVSTFYQDRTIRLWAYSERYLRSLLSVNGFSITKRSSRHHLSPLVYLACRNSNMAARFHVLDTVARRIPVMKSCASHVIYSCRKIV
jgi:hypothetical protein